MTELAWDRALGRGGLPYVAGREPRDGLFVRLDVGGAGPDAPRVDDLLEFQTGRVVEDCIGRVGVGWRCGRRDGDQIDGEFHGVGTYWLGGGVVGKKAAGRSQRLREEPEEPVSKGG